MDFRGKSAVCVLGAAAKSAQTTSADGTESYEIPLPINIKISRNRKEDGGGGLKFFLGSRHLDTADFSTQTRRN